MGKLLSVSDRLLDLYHLVPRISHGKSDTVIVSPLYILMERIWNSVSFTKTFTSFYDVRTGISFQNG